jgi:radical SAM superfamily enzyme YgiQ (UPF0313 family)
VNFTVDRIKKHFPEVKVVFGGIIPSLLPGTVQDWVKADYYLYGAGENQILDFIRQQNGKVYAAPNLNNINHIPFPAYEYLSNKNFLPLLTSRGCPFNCDYCASKILSRGFFERTHDDIFNEIQTMYRKHDSSHFIIFDDAFLVNKRNRFLKVFHKIRKYIPATFHTPNGIHPREIDQETANLLFECGFKTVRLSFESIHSSTLSQSSQKVEIHHMVTAVKNLVEAGFKKKDLECYLLFGLPGQTIKEIEESLFFVRELGIIPHLAWFSPVPGTEVFRQLQKSGIISTPINPYQTNKTYFIYQKSGYSQKEIQYIRDLTATINRSVRGK